jgi:hypothetical protein
MAHGYYNRENLEGGQTIGFVEGELSSAEPRKIERNGGKRGELVRYLLQATPGKAGVL